MLAGRTRKGKPIFSVWQVTGSKHELIIKHKLPFTTGDHRDAAELFRQLAKNELGENGPTEFYHQYRRLQEMHLTHVSSSQTVSPPMPRSSSQT